MQTYLLSMYQPSGPRPDAAVLAPVMEQLSAWQRALREAGAQVFTGRLQDPEQATVVDGDETRRGPLAPGELTFGGFVVVQTATAAEAVDWGRQFSQITHLPIEVRPLLEERQ